MAGSRALEMIFDDLQPALREEPPIDGQTSIVRGLARTSAGVRFEDRGEQVLKGVGERVRVWAVRTSGG